MSGDETLYPLYEPQLPVVALLISPNLDTRHAIHRGIQTASIRMGLRDYHVGQKLALYCSILPWAVESIITKVRHCKLCDLTEAELRAAGLSTVYAREHPLLNLGEFYPDATLNSRVTFIQWGPVRGYWVDHSHEYFAYHEEMLAQIPHN